MLSCWITVGMMVMFALYANKYSDLISQIAFVCAYMMHRKRTTYAKSAGRGHIVATA